MTTPPKPGIRKTRGMPLLRARPVLAWQCSDYDARRILESADVMSEGACRDEALGSDQSASVYYGSTSVLLATESRGGIIPDDRVCDVLRWALSHPHLRLRLLRLARQEASLRAEGELSRVNAELIFRRVASGIQIDVEVEATKLVERLTRRPA